MFPSSPNGYFQLDGVVLEQAQFMGSQLSMNEIVSYEQVLNSIIQEKKGWF